MNYPKNRYTGDKPWMDREWLYTEYVIKDRSTKNIAEEFGCKQNTIQCWLIKHNIKKDVKKSPRKIQFDYQNPDFLYYQHIILHKSMTQIAKENNISIDTAKYYLLKYNIQYWQTTQKNRLTQEDAENIVKLYNELLLSANQIARIYSTSHNVIIRTLKRMGVSIRNLSKTQIILKGKEYDDRLDDAEWLEMMHWEQNKSCKEIGQILGYDDGTIRRQMHKLGIRTKTNSESKIGLMAGDKHPNWKGGITPLKTLLREYFHTNQVPIIAKRDMYTCQMCGKQHTILHVHHIRPFYEIVDEIVYEHSELNVSIAEDMSILYNICIHDDRFLDNSNLITLCKTCHQQRVYGKTISSQASFNEEGSETISIESKLQAIGS